MRAVRLSPRLLSRELPIGRLLYPEHATDRPTHRSQCRDQPRPCPWVSCRMHLFLDVNPKSGTMTLNFPDLEPWELPVSCALDVAEQGGMTLDELGSMFGLTRERIRQIESIAGDKLLRLPDLLGLRELLAAEPRSDLVESVASDV